MIIKQAAKVQAISTTLLNNGETHQAVDICSTGEDIAYELKVYGKNVDLVKAGLGAELSLTLETKQDNPLICKIVGFKVEGGQLTMSLRSTESGEITEVILNNNPASPEQIEVSQDEDKKLVLKIAAVEVGSFNKLSREVFRY